MKLYYYFYFFTPLIVVVSSYLFGLATSSRERKIEACRERYNHLYLPFMNWLIHVPLTWVPPIRYTVKERHNLMSLLLDNAQFMGDESSKLLIRFYDAHLNLDEFDINKNPNYSYAPPEYQNQFNLMANALLKESTKLAKTLKLPELPKTISAMYDQQQEKLK